MVMAQMVRELMQDPPGTENRTVSRRDYEQWTRGFVFEAMRNLSYGQSFCNHFGIRDNILYYAGTMSDADEYIRKNYVR
jgi:hypothetical protein